MNESKEKSSSSQRSSDSVSNPHSTISRMNADPSSDGNVHVHDSGGTSLKSDDWNQMNAPVSAIDEGNELKPRLTSMASVITSLGKNTNKKFGKMEKDMKEMKEDMKEMKDDINLINKRFSYLIGEDKRRDDVAVIIEKQAKKWLERHYPGREFIHSFNVKCNQGRELNFDVFSAPSATDDAFIIAECTIALTSAIKVSNFVDKIEELREDSDTKEEVAGKEIITHMFALRISPDKEAAILKAAADEHISLHITQAFLPSTSADGH